MLIATGSEEQKAARLSAHMTVSRRRRTHTASLSDSDVRKKKKKREQHLC